MPLTVLMYHEVVVPDALDVISKKINSTYVVVEDLFRRHLEAIRDAGASVVTPDQVYAWLESGVSIPDDAVMITFDDGFGGNFDLAYPLLKAFGFTATFYVVTNRIGDELMLNWEQLREMQNEGMTIASHTASHPLLSTLDRSETEFELEHSAKVLEQHLALPFRHLSLPNGDTNQWYRQIATELGYRTVSGSQFGRNSEKADRLYLNRVAIKSNTSADDIKAYIGGHWRIYAANALKSVAKKVLVGALTKRRYDALYNRFAGVDEQRKESAH